MKAILALEDGKFFSGESFGVSAESIGEVILNTAVVGFQEMITDPANSEKILVFTYPLIGNYGCAPKFNESKKSWLSGLVIKEKSRIHSNWQAKESFEEFIKNKGVAAIAKVDTRTLAVHLRQKGEMPGIISTSDLELKSLLGKIKEFRKKALKSKLAEISLSKPEHRGAKRCKYKIAVLDLGITGSMIKQLEALGLGLVILPYNFSPQEIRRFKVDGLIISNGPEEDSGLAGVVENIKPLIGKLPVLGVSTGHQVLARALGAKVNKMKLGHRGVNYPLARPADYKGEITAQNHAYVVDADSVAGIKGIRISGYNLNDRSVEEIESKKFKVLGVQYLPLSPGLGEVNSVFRRFLKIL